MKILKNLDYSIFLGMKNGIFNDLEDGWYVTEIISDKITFNVKNGFINSEQDNPAIIREDSQHWYKNGKLHRDNGPATILNTGKEKWYQEGKLHREDGPAEITDVQEKWYYKGLVHKDDGPAVVNKLKESLYVVFNHVINKDVFDSLPRNEHEKIHSLEPIEFFNNYENKIKIYVINGEIKTKEEFDSIVLDKFLNKIEKNKNIKI